MLLAHTPHSFKVAPLLLTALASANAGTQGTVTAILVALIAAGGTLGGIYLSRRLNQVHVLVNSRLDEALAQIAALKFQAGTRLTPEEERRVPGDLGA